MSVRGGGRRWGGATSTFEWRGTHDEAGGGNKPEVERGGRRPFRQNDASHHELLKLQRRT